MFMFSQHFNCVRLNGLLLHEINKEIKKERKKVFSKVFIEFPIDTNFKPKFTFEFLFARYYVVTMKFIKRTKWLCCYAIIISFFLFFVMKQNGAIHCSMKIKMRTSLNVIFGVKTQQPLKLKLKMHVLKNYKNRTKWHELCALWLLDK